MKWLNEKLAGSQISVVEKGILEPPKEQDICTWIDACPWTRIHKGEIGCISEHFADCLFYDHMTDKQLEEFDKNLKDMCPKKAQAFVNGLPKEIYIPFLKKILEQRSKFYAVEDESVYY